MGNIANPLILNGTTSLTFSTALWAHVNTVSGIYQTRATVHGSQSASILHFQSSTEVKREAKLLLCKVLQFS